MKNNTGALRKQGSSRNKTTTARTAAAVLSQETLLTSIETPSAFLTFQYSSALRLSVSILCLTAEIICLATLFCTAMRERETLLFCLTGGCACSP